MKLMFDIGHPAHVHYFKNLILELKKKNHQIKVTARDRPIIFDLLEANSIPYIDRGEGGKGIWGKLVYMLKADLMIHRIVKQFKPDMMINFGAVYYSQVSKLNQISNITIDDTDHARLNHFFYRYVAETILTPTTFVYTFSENHQKFPSYMELAYLHPNWFTPDDSVFKDLGVDKGERYVIVRFVGWDAVHDIGHQGISLKNKIRAIHDFSEYARVFISSEKELPGDLQEYQIDIPPEKMHDALAFATLFYGESATMASESAVLGTPAIYLDNEGRGYTTEQENRYGLVHNFTESEEDQLNSIEKGVAILKDYDEKKWQNRWEKMLKDKIDLTSFLVWFVENYPASREKVKSDQSIFTNFN